MQTFSLILLGFVLVLAVLIFRSSRTPFGRIAPIFGAVFGLSRLAESLQSPARREAADRARAAIWGNPEQRGKARAAFIKYFAMLSKPVPYPGSIVNRSVVGEAGDIPIRIYTPEGEGPFPVLVYYHGGGWVIGDIEYTDGVTRSISLGATAVVVSVDYRLAPEHAFPAAAKDAHRVLEWVFDGIDALSGRADRVSVAGDSAGGNLAAVVAVMDGEQRPRRLDLQVLIYPVIDLTDTTCPSYRRFERGWGLSKIDMDSMIDAYTPDAESRSDPHASPVFAKNMGELPRALVITAGFDVLLDGGLRYIQQLEAAGVEVRHRHFSQMPHGFITLSRLCREAQKAIGDIAAAIGRGA